MEGGGGAAKRLQSKVISSTARAGGGASRNQSPERLRRKDKWATERQEQELPVPVEEEGARRRRLQDPVALEDTADDNGRAAGRPFKRSRVEAQNAGVNVNPEYVPRSGYFFEHDDRSSWRPRPNPRRRPFGIPADGGLLEDRKHLRKPDERWAGGVQEEVERGTNSRWHHDGFLELENTDNRMGRNRRSESNGGKFRDAEGWVGRRPGNHRMNGRGALERGRWGEEKEDYAPERGRRVFAKAGRFRRSINVRDTGEARDNAFNQSKWKHDMYEDVTRSPAAKREEESVAKIEALLAA